MDVIGSSQQAFALLDHLRRLEVEEFWVILLHANKKVIGRECVFRGTVDCCPVFPRDVFRSACRLNAAAIIVAHNHPSGDRFPSSSDRLMTKRLVDGGKLLGIPVLDHLIIVADGFWSFADCGMLKVRPSPGQPPADH